MAKRNALAELAVRLGTDALSLGADKYPEIETAQQIIAELAKVKLNGVGWPVRIELADAYEQCRAKAEEWGRNETMGR